MKNYEKRFFFSRARTSFTIVKKAFGLIPTKVLALCSLFTHQNPNVIDLFWINNFSCITPSVHCTLSLALDHSSCIFNQIEKWLCACVCVRERKQCESAFENQSNVNITSSFSIYRYSFFLFHFVKFYDNAIDVWIWRMAIWDECSAEREKSKFTFIKFLFTGVEVVHWKWNRFFFSSLRFRFVCVCVTYFLLADFLIDWFLCVGSCSRMKDYSQCYSIDIVLRYGNAHTVKDISLLPKNFCILIVRLLSNGK